MSITINTDNVVEVACQTSGCRCVPIASKGLPVSIKEAIDYDIKTNGATSSFVVLPVFEIDGLKVRCDLIVNQNGMSIFIRCTNIIMYAKRGEDINMFVQQILFRKTYIKKLTKYTLKDYESVIRIINSDIRDMKFDKLNGVLTTPEITHPKMAPYVREYDELFNVPCDEVNPDDCCVCLDTTKTTTPCGHKLCVSCWNSIKINKGEVPCPMCRVNLMQTKETFGKDFVYISPYDDDEDYEYDSDEGSDFDDYYDSYGFRYETDHGEDHGEFPSVRENTIVDLT
jgi:hypothetical protein